VRAADTDDEPVLSVTKDARDALTPDQIVEKLNAGNLRFRTGRSTRILR
jgi:hypothetical protein